MLQNLTGQPWLLLSGLGNGFKNLEVFLHLGFLNLKNFFQKILSFFLPWLLLLLPGKVTIIFWGCGVKPGCQKNTL